MKQATPTQFSYFPPERPRCWPSDIFNAAGKPLGIVARNWRHETPVMALLFFTILIFFAATAPHTVALEDDALFITSLHFWGVSHPPGYPAHTLLGGIFYHLFPWGSSAFRAHLFSAAAGAATCTVLYAVVAMLVYGRLFPALAALAYACSQTFWSQAIITEVYTLNTLIIFILLALALRYAGSRKPPRRLLFMMAVTSGIGLANHYPLLLLSLTGIALLVVPRLPRLLALLPAAATAGAAATPFYVWMIWRSYQPVAGNFYGEPIASAEQFWFYVLRQGYQTIDQQPNVGWDDKLVFAEHFAADLLWQFTPLGLALAAAGFILMLRSRYGWLLVCLLVSFLSSSVLLLLLLDFQARYLALSVIRVYYLPAYGFMAIWLALGAAWGIDCLSRCSIFQRRLAGMALITLLIGTTAASHWALNNRSGYVWAETLTRTKLDSVEPNAVLFLHDDLDLPAVYLHTVAGERPDLDIYSDQGLVLPNRLFSPLLPEYPPADNPQSPNRAAYIHEFIERAYAPIYYNNTQYPIFTTPRLGSVETGFYRRVNDNSPENRVDLNDGVLPWLQKNLAGSEVLHDPWSRFQQYETISLLMNAVVQAAENGQLALTDDWNQVIRTARAKNAKVRVLTNLIRLNRLTPEEQQAEADWLAAFSLDDEHLMDKFGRGRFYLLQARLTEKISGKEAPLYEQALLRALEEDERPSNPGIVWLLDYYSEQDERYCTYIAMIEQYYPDIGDIPPARLDQLRTIRKNALC